MIDQPIFDGSTEEAQRVEMRKETEVSVRRKVVQIPSNYCMTLSANPT